MGLRHVDAQPQQLVVDVGEMFADEVGGLVADVQMHEIEAVALDLGIDGARHDVARGQFQPLVISGMKRWPVLGLISRPPRRAPPR
jgi:hypothetical protein